MFVRQMDGGGGFQGEEWHKADKGHLRAKGCIFYCVSNVSRKEVYHVNALDFVAVFYLFEYLQG